MAPVVDRLTDDYAGIVEVRTMNVEKDAEASQLASSFKVQYVPTFVFVRSDGTTADMVVGEVSEDDLRDTLDALN
jgi:thioredoxin-like negative regulator of GroEL